MGETAASLRLARALELLGRAAVRLHAANELLFSEKVLDGGEDYEEEEAFVAEIRNFLKEDK